VVAWCGQNITLSCNVESAFFPVTITWLKHGSNEGLHSEVSTDTEYISSESILRISNAKESDSGAYSCVVTSTVDTVNKTLILKVSNTTMDFPTKNLTATPWLWATFGLLLLILVVVGTSVYFYQKSKVINGIRNF